MPHHIRISFNQAVLVDTGVSLRFKEPLNLKLFQANMERLEKVAAGQAIDNPQEFVHNLGKQLFNAVFGSEFQPQDMLALELEDDALHYLPWELMHDGTDYVALRYGVLRLVKGQGQGFYLYQLVSA